MKLLIFKPSEKWRHCGGCIIVAAPDMQGVMDCIKLYNEPEIEKEEIRDLARETFGCYSDEFLSLPDGDTIEEPFYSSEEEAGEAKPDLGHSWILHSSYEVKDVKDGIIFRDYNYG
jgi:hypothetical protein